MRSSGHLPGKLTPVKLTRGGKGRFLFGRMDRKGSGPDCKFPLEYCIQVASCRKYGKVPQTIFIKTILVKISILEWITRIIMSCPLITTTLIDACTDLKGIMITLITAPYIKTQGSSLG